MADPHRSRRAPIARLIRLGVPTLIVAVVVGLAIAWSSGAFESRVAYWQARGRDCGDVTYGPNGALSDPTGTVPSVVSCFATAYAHCEAATLTRGVGGVDTVESETFVVEPRSAGGCDVGLHHEFSIVGSDRTTTTEMQCASLTWDGTLLTFVGCGDLGNIVVPTAHV